MKEKGERGVWIRTMALSCITRSIRVLTTFKGIGGDGATRRWGRRRRSPQDREAPKSRAVFDSAIASLPTRAGVEPAISRLSASAFSEVTARSLPPKIIMGENRRSPPGALPVRRLLAKPALVFAAMVRTWHGDCRLERSNFTFTTQKIGASCRICAGLSAVQAPRVANYA